MQSACKRAKTEKKLLKVGYLLADVKDSERYTNHCFLISEQDDSMTSCILYKQACIPNAQVKQCMQYITPQYSFYNQLLIAQKNFKAVFNCRT